MQFYSLPSGVNAQYTYKGIRLTWDDLSTCNFYTLYLNLENDPKNGEYKAISPVIDTPNTYTIENNLFRERQIVPYIKIYGFTDNPEYENVTVDSANKIITMASPGTVPNINIVHVYANTGYQNIVVTSVENDGTTLTLHTDDTVTDMSDASMYIADPIEPTDSYGPFTVRLQPRKFAIEIARRLDVLFKARYKDAAKVYVYHRRKHGERCTCWDEYEDAVADSNCPICYGVGYKGGYVGPEEMYITNSVPQITGAYDSRGERTRDQDNLLMAIGNMDVYLEPNDIIIDALGTRYSVLSIRYSSIDKSVLVSQSLTLQVLPKNDIIYKLEP